MSNDIKYYYRYTGEPTREMDMNIPRRALDRIPAPTGRVFALYTDAWDQSVTYGWDGQWRDDPPPEEVKRQEREGRT
jgi:hypothetical protein